MHVEQPELPPLYTPRDGSDSTLVFESRFESGNLEGASQVFVSRYIELRADWYQRAVRV